jgi:hypothetical protein
VFPPPTIALRPERYIRAMHSFSSTTVFSFLPVNCCNTPVYNNYAIERLGFMR